MELVQTRNIFDQKITVIKGDLIGRKILKHGAYDKAGLFLIERLLSGLESPVCLDVGANIGNHSLVMSRYSAKVISFEPQPAVFKVLVKNLEDNKILNVQPLQFGLSDWSGQASMNVVDASNTGATSFASHAGAAESIEAELRRGDDEVKRLGISSIDFIKIDVEGLETFVIEGLRESIASYKPIIMLEWNSSATREGFRDKELFSKILYGYSAFSVSSNHEKPAGGESKLAKLSRKFSRKFLKPRVRLGQFDAAQDYGNVVLVPLEKQDVVRKRFVIDA
ncbi:FkbM family methyltransferase [Pseudomonas sp. GOM7]|uniref:FkbM family methyltransferase n=1 Tax=Pseudomonas sp. GOM7 TaxID=2998079 RepID=UPI00227A5E90|nr:FkbM family methyltransferase [Pseudomonas sp. GOM7]WAJ37292.1 FkbM family methyltransferase [Pseudomonas sp. GOM7]